MQDALSGPEAEELSALMFTVANAQSRARNSYSGLESLRERLPGLQAGSRGWTGSPAPTAAPKADGPPVCSAARGAARAQRLLSVCPDTCGSTKRWQTGRVDHVHTNVHAPNPRLITEGSRPDAGRTSSRKQYTTPIKGRTRRIVEELAAAGTPLTEAGDRHDAGSPVAGRLQITRLIACGSSAGVARGIDQRRRRRRRPQYPRYGLTPHGEAVHALGAARKATPGSAGAATARSSGRAPSSRQLTSPAPAMRRVASCSPGSAQSSSRSRSAANSGPPRERRDLSSTRSPRRSCLTSQETVVLVCCRSP